MTNYTTINHRVRKELNLSLSEYCLMDLVYNLANNPKSNYPNWCYGSKPFLARCLDFSEREVYRYINKLIKLGLLEKEPKLKHLRTTEKWYNAAIINHNENEDLSTHDKMAVPMTIWQLDHDKMAVPPPDKMSPNNSINNNSNINTNTDVLVLAKAYGKPEINDMFLFWEKTVGYQVRSKPQANRRACSNLIKKHGAAALEALVRGVARAHTDEYAPRIADFCDLQSKTNQLVAWGKTKMSEQPTVWSDR
jgi:hypothetical protein